jgi:large subunit ribosomal protein L32
MGKHTKRLQRTKRAQLVLKKPKFVKCSRCGSAKLHHRICLNCGTYKGREVIDVLAKLEKKERKKKAKELEEAQEKQPQAMDAASLSKKESKEKDSSEKEEK